ncbi:MAG: N-acetylglucosamine-6-phosphate deacetylase [bacterium]
MYECPSCGRNYEVGDAICHSCGIELPDPALVADENTENDDVIIIPEVPEGAIIFSGAEVFLPHTSYNPGTVIVYDGIIMSVLPFAWPDIPSHDIVFDVSGKFITAGFIDIHSHGILGIDINKATSHDFQKLSISAAKYGVTSMVPTIAACSAHDLRQIFLSLREARHNGLEGARILGLHYESNFINPSFAGAQPRENIFSFDDSRANEIKDIIDLNYEEMRIMTIAPEMSGGKDLISWLNDLDIIVSLGHSGANYEQAIEAFDAGATQVTHIFNAMAPLHHRSPNLVGAALERDDVYVQLICDGEHVHPAVMTAVIIAKGIERLVPITDSLPGAGLKDGEFVFAGRKVTVSNNIAKLDDGVIAGSVMTMDKMIAHLIDGMGWNMVEAFSMASNTAANSIGIDDIGVIKKGAAADLIILDEDLNVEMTLVAGKPIYQKN